MYTETWFSSQLFIEDMSDVLPLAKKACIGVENRAITQPYSISNGGITTYPTDTIFLSEEYDPLVARIINVVTNVATIQGIDMSNRHVILNHIWVNRMYYGSEHGAHSHAPSMYSGCMYVDSPEGSSSTRFYNPIYSLAMASPLPEHIKATYEWAEVSPQEGKLVVWNGWLVHSVPKNSSNEARHTISFNTHIEENK